MGKSVRYSELSSLSRYHGATELNFIATISLREKCPYSEFFWSVFSRIRTRKTPNMGTFYAAFIMLSWD